MANRRLRQDLELAGHRILSNGLVVLSDTPVGGGTGDLLAENNLSELTDIVAARGNLGLVIGTDVQAQSAILSSLASLPTTGNLLLYFTGPNTLDTTYFTAAARTFLAANDAPSQLALLAGAPLDSPTFTGTVTLPGDPTNALQAVTKQYADGLAANLGKRTRVRAATTGSITIATALNDGDVLDGVTLEDGDLVLVKDQAATEANGVYVVGGVPARSTEYDDYDEFPGSLIAVVEGTENADTIWLTIANSGGTIGVDPITFSKLVVAGELLAGNNLSDVANAATARSNLGIGLATPSTAGFIPALSNVDGAVPVENGAGGSSNRRLTMDDIDPAFAVSSFVRSNFSSAAKELGDTIVNPSFTATYNAGFATLTIGDGTNTDFITIPAAENAFGYNNGGGSGLPARSYSRTGINQTVTWTLTATKSPSGPVRTSTVTNSWQPRVFYGVATVPGGYNEAFIEGLATSRLQSGFSNSYALSAGTAGQKGFVAFPTAFGTPVLFKDHVTGFGVPTTVVATGVAVTNVFGVLVSGGYTVCRTDDDILSSLTLDLS